MSKSVLSFFCIFFILAHSAASRAAFTEENSKNSPATTKNAEISGLVNISIDDVSANESDGSVSFTVSLSEPPTSNVSMSYATQNGSAKAGSDYTAKSGSLTIASGLTSGTITINLIDDNIDEFSESFTVNLSNPSANGNIQDGQGRATISDNDGPPSLSIDNASADEDDGSIFFNVRLSSASGKDIEVDYETSDGSAKDGSDYTAKSGTLSISAGASSGTISIALLDDALDESNENFTVELSNPSNASLSDATATGTIRDNDSQPSISIDDASADENDGSMTFTVTLSKASGKQVEVDYQTSDGTATAGSDYTSKSGTLTFAPGATSRSFSVTIQDDNIDEDDEHFNVELSNQQNASLADDQAQGTIRDNDLPSLSIDDPSADEDDGPLSFAVSLSRASAVPVAVQYATSDGTATSGDDYTSTSGNLTIPAGMTSRTILISIQDDDVYESDETLTVTLSNPTNATISDDSGTGTIRDDDLPELEIDHVSADESDGTMTFTVSLSDTIPDVVTVDYQTKDSTATAGDDYTEKSGTLTFDAGTSSQTITIDIDDDTADENDEIFMVVLSNPSNATIAVGEGFAVIIDNDVTPSIVIGDKSVGEDAGNFTLNVTLSQASLATVTVDFATVDSSAKAADDYLATSGTLTFNPGSTSESITIAVVEDSLDEDTEILTVVLSNPTNAKILDSLGVVEIADNDDPPLLSIDDVSLQEPDTSTATMNFTVSLSAPSSRDVSFDFSTTDSTAVAPDDYVATSGTQTIAAGSTAVSIMVIVESDSLAEFDEAFGVSLSNLVNATFADSQGVGTILGELAISVVLESFTAITGSESVELDWETSSETENAGFHLLRSQSQDSGYQQINAELLPGAGTTTETQSYSYADTSAQSGETYFYQLISVHNDSSSYAHPPIEISVGPFTSVDPRVDRGWPESFALAQNYPNPFNPSTTIRFYLPVRSQVDLSIYNMAGQLVRTLVAGPKNAGTYSIFWDATDAQGRQVASGSYLYVLKAAEFVSQKRLLFLK